MGVVMNEQPGKRTKKFEISTKYQRYILTEDILICSLTGPFSRYLLILRKLGRFLGTVLGEGETQAHAMALDYV